MNVVDSSGWLEYFTAGKNAAVFEPIIFDQENVVTPTLSIFEVFKKTLKERGENAALQVAAAMQQTNVIDLDSPIALEAASLSLKHKLPAADSIILATARKHNATLWTQDSDFKDLPNIKYIPKNE